MAYSAVSTWTWIDARRGQGLLKIVELEAAAGSVATIAATVGVPRGGVVVRVECRRSAGDAATVAPVLGYTATPATQAIVSYSAATSVNDVPTAPVAYGDEDGTTAAVLYHGSVVNAGVNNTVTTYYYIRTGGWGGGA